MSLEMNLLVVRTIQKLLFFSCFVVQWLAKHEEFIPNPFYVGGHSYTGKIVPPLVQEISKGNVWVL